MIESLLKDWDNFYVIMGSSAAGLSIGTQVKGYTPVAEDWIWHVALPFAAYGAMLASAFFIWSHTGFCLYVVAGVAAALTFIGIHNAWDIAVFNSLRQAGENPET